MTKNVQEDLIRAASHGDTATVDFLLRMGAHPDLGAGELQGETPLAAAARGQHEKTVKRLLQGGADPELRSGYDGRTAGELAEVFGYRGVAAILRESQAMATAGR